MGLRNFLRGLPEWAAQLPSHLRPAPDQIRRLEVIGEKAGVSHTDFLMHIAGHPETARRVQRHMYRQIKQQMPAASEREVLTQLLLSRLTSAFGQGSDLFDLAAIADDEAAVTARVDDIISRHSDLESLVDAMIEDEERRERPVPAAPGFEDAVRRVSEILSER